MNLTQTDPQIAELIQLEKQRQESTLELIASENHVSAAVMEAAGTCLTNKYAEGYPGARYYGGCGYYDQIENLAIDRAKKLFGCPLRQRPAPQRRQRQPRRLHGHDEAR